MGIEGYFFDKENQNNKTVILNARGGEGVDANEESHLKKGGDVRLPDEQESHPDFRGDSSLTLRMTNKGDVGVQDDKKSKLKLLSVCHLLPIKNLEAVLAAINGLPEKERIAYDIYGAGPEKKKLIALVKKWALKDMVTFKGAVANKELPEIMSQYDVFIQPSFKETLGLSYFEALACGLPVILTKNTGAYEIIKEKDVYYLVDPNDPRSISDCLNKMLRDRKTLDKKALLAPEVAKIASWEGFVDYFHEKYEEVVSKRLSLRSEAMKESGTT
jgi:glycosyltransferase involved in cell wall biosynthesis